MEPKQIVHRPGVFKKPNKPHKAHGKSSVRSEQKGKEVPKMITKSKVKAQVDRQQRRNQMQYLRKLKREEILNEKRNHGSEGKPPFLVAIVPLCQTANSHKILGVIKSCPDSTVWHNERNTHINVNRFKQRFSFLCPAYGDLYATLDAAKAADCLLFSLSIDAEGLDDYGDYLLSCLFSHGLPSILICLQGLKSLPLKKQTETKKVLSKQLEKRFPDAKIHNIDDSQDALLILRAIGNQKLIKILMRDRRPHLLANEVTFEPNSIDESVGTLKVSGYLRGRGITVNDFVHIPGFGDFQMLQIDGRKDLHSLSNNSKDSEDVKILETTDLLNRPLLESEVAVDPMTDEQTWPTEQEIATAQAKYMKKIKKKAPKGVSDYQAMWLDTEEDDEEEEEGVDGTMNDVNMEDDDDEDEAVSGSDSEDGVVESSNQEMEDDDTADETTGDEDYDKKVNFDDDALELEKYKESRLDAMFPDEIDTPHDVPARIRFQKYRGLRSYRTSPWLCKDDNLPPDYQRIRKFENFKRACKQLLSIQNESDKNKMCQPGRYITLHIEKVPANVMNEYKNVDQPLIVYGLIANEQFMSLLHFVIKYRNNSDEIIKSKEPIIFHVGYRRFKASPIYSEHTTADKHKMERFLKTDSVVVASVYAPVMLPPASVLMFKEMKDGDHKLVASGRILSADPDRLITKRIILSGSPFKIDKKSSVIRYMFFNRDDILWFKPVELRTKLGKRGTIKEPLGTHGHMKCSFNGQLKSSDVVLLHLYKRQFPKWNYEATVSNPFKNSNDAIMDIF